MSLLEFFIEQFGSVVTEAQSNDVVHRYEEFRGHYERKGLHSFKEENEAAEARLTPIHKGPRLVNNQYRYQITYQFAEGVR